jgi:hypothetical protein
MADFIQKEKTGTLFPNDKRTGNQPHYRGSIMLNGEEFEVAAWEKEGKRGPFLSLSVKPKEERGGPF